MINQRLTSGAARYVQYVIHLGTTEQSATKFLAMKFCKQKDKHPELLNDIRTLQRELKELEQKYAKAKNETDVFNASRQRAKSSFFAIMRPRLRKQNPAKYLERSALDRDLMILQRALKNKVPLDESNDWRLPNVIEEYKHGIVDPLRVQWATHYEVWRNRR